MSLSYTTGNPNNLTAGGTAAMNDIQGPFTDIKTFLTDGSGAVGDTILTSPANSVWRAVLSQAGNINGTLTTGLWYFSGGTGLVASAATANSAIGGVWAPTTADLAVAGKTTRLRLRVMWMTNGAGPGITVTWGLYPFTVGGGNNVIGATLGTVITGSTASVASPGANSAGLATGTSFDISTLTSGQPYILGVTGSGSQTATSLVACQVILEMRHT